MSLHEESHSFAADLHDTALTFDAPNTEVLYSHAVTGGRRIKRRWAAQGALGALAAVAVAGSLAFSLAPGTRTHLAKPAATASVHRTVTYDGPVSGEYMLENFKALLPTDVKIDPPHGGATLTGVSYAIYGTNSGWSAEAYTTATVNGQRVGVSLSVDRPNYVSTCALGVPRGGSCTTTSLGGGATLVEYEWPVDMASQFEFYRNLPGGVDVHLTVRGDRAGNHPALTMSQILALVTAPVWDKALADLPAAIDCPSGIQPQNGGLGLYWVCTGDGRLFPNAGATNIATNL